ncbi:MAG: hypothetical protein Q8P66_03240, partial [Candidatus Colwellbacteria bacterium]|nr:hypothetical protein [Candidatus Colwellbacteria bacterium]
LATGAADILEDLGLLGGEAEIRRLAEGIEEISIQPELSDYESLILEVIKTAGRPLEVDRIAPLANLEAQAVNQSLTGLLLKGLIREANGKYEISYR